MRAKLATLGLFKKRYLEIKVMTSWFVHDITNHILSRSANNIVDAVEWLKFANSSIFMREVFGADSCVCRRYRGKTDKLFCLQYWIRLSENTFSSEKLVIGTCNLNSDTLDNSEKKLINKSSNRSISNVFMNCI